MRKNRVIEQNSCYHLVSRLALRAFFLDDEEKDLAVALMRRIEAGVQVSMSYCINSAVLISSDPFVPRPVCTVSSDRHQAEVLRPRREQPHVPRGDGSRREHRLYEQNQRLHGFREVSQLSASRMS